MSDVITMAEVAERERVIEVFMARVALAEDSKETPLKIQLTDAVEIRDELERLYEIERRYDNMAGLDC